VNILLVASALTRFRSPGPAAAVTPIPSGDRCAVVLRALGAPQLLYRSETTGRVRERRGRVHIYVDVSGSIADLKYTERCSTAAMWCIPPFTCSPPSYTTSPSPGFETENAGPLAGPVLSAWRPI
jgi:hypothetical protein